MDQVTWFRTKRGQVTWICKAVDPYISRISPVNLEAAKQVKGVDAEAVYLPYISRKYPVYLPYISQVKGVDAEPVAATTAGAAEGLWEEHP